MTVTDSRRLALFDHARSAWGEDAATTLMELLPMDPDELATKADLHATEHALRVELYKALSEQTRTLILTSVGIMLTGISLAFAAARLG